MNSSETLAVAINQANKAINTPNSLEEMIRLISESMSLPIPGINRNYSFFHKYNPKDFAPEFPPEGAKQREGLNINLGQINPRHYHLIYQM